MRTNSLDDLLSELDVLPHYVDDPDRPMRLALAVLAVLLLLLMLLLPSASGLGGALFVAADSAADSAPASSTASPAGDLS